VAKRRDDVLSSFLQLCFFTALSVFYSTFCVVLILYVYTLHKIETATKRDMLNKSSKSLSESDQSACFEPVVHALYTNAQTQLKLRAHTVNVTAAARPCRQQTSVEISTCSLLSSGETSLGERSSVLSIRSSESFTSDENSGVDEDGESC